MPIRVSSALTVALFRGTPRVSPLVVTNGGNTILGIVSPKAVTNVNGTIGLNVTSANALVEVRQLVEMMLTTRQ